jgi:hypothetical protein
MKQESFFRNLDRDNWCSACEDSWDLGEYSVVGAAPSLAHRRCFGGNRGRGCGCGCGWHFGMVLLQDVVLVHPRLVALACRGPQEALDLVWYCESVAWASGEQWNHRSRTDAHYLDSMDGTHHSGVLRQ